MDSEKIKNIVEGALIAAGRPLTLDNLLGLFKENEAPAREELKNILETLAEELKDRSVELKKVSSGYRLQVKSEFAPWISRLWEDKAPRYSRAFMETLALIVYRQPITRGEIEAIRGVSVSSSIIRSLMELEWIKAIGHRDVPGKPALFGTTKKFLDSFNLKSLEELPSLAELRSLDEINTELGFSGANKAAQEPGKTGELPLAESESRQQVISAGEITPEDDSSSATNDGKNEKQELQTAADDAVALKSAKNKKEKNKNKASVAAKPAEVSAEESAAAETAQNENQELKTPADDEVAVKSDKSKKAKSKKKSAATKKNQVVESEASEPEATENSEKDSQALAGHTDDDASVTSETNIEDQAVSAEKQSTASSEAVESEQAEAINNAQNKSQESQTSDAAIDSKKNVADSVVDSDSNESEIVAGRS